MANDLPLLTRVWDFLVRRWRPALIGGLLFWCPDVLRSYFVKSEPSAAAIGVLTFLMPLVVIAGYLIMRRNPQTEASARIETSILLGIWILGPTMVGIAQTFQGVGFRFIGTLPVVIFATIFPPVLLIMAGYDLSIFALLLATSVLIVLRLKRRVTDLSLPK
jgi:hypothetical protein